MTLRKLGIERVRPLRGGYDEWKRLGYPLDAIAPVMPLVQVLPGYKLSHQLFATNSAAILVPMGEPIPLHASGPGAASYIPLLPCVMSLKALWFCQSFGVTKPSLVPKLARALHRAEQPRWCHRLPPSLRERKTYSRCWDPHRHRRPEPSGRCRTLSLPAQVVRQSEKLHRKMVEKPPLSHGHPWCRGFRSKPSPWSQSYWFTTSHHMRQEAGASTFAGVGPPSLESLSPVAPKTTMPMLVAASATDSIASTALAPQRASSAPHEMEQTAHPSSAAFCTAVPIFSDQ